MRFFPAGDFATCSNDVETVCRRVNPADFDGDGIANEIDPNPLVCDGDFFGPANILPDGANTNAYCTVSLVATGPDTLVAFEGDRPSDYPDPRFVARHGETNEVLILIGKTYTVSSAWPIEFTGSSDSATEIFAVGYPQWVDAQVGTGLTNGLYKLTVAVACDPPETTFLSVGDHSVAVTNAGEYVFLLEKGPAYDLTVFPPSSNVTISAVDDVPSMRGTPMMRSFGGADSGQWVPDSGEFWTDYVAGMGYARLWWLPWLCGSPDVTHIDPTAGPVTFHADLLDYRGSAASFLWTGSEALTIASPNSQTTAVTADLADWRLANLSVTASFGFDRSLTSYLYVSYGTNDSPQVSCSLSVQSVHFINEGDRPERVYPVFFVTNGWTRSECEVAFDKYLAWVSTNDMSAVDSQEKMFARSAFAQCRDMKYTKALDTIRTYALNTTAIDRVTVIGRAVQFGGVDEASASFVEAIVTNKAQFSYHDISWAIPAYCDKLRSVNTNDAEAVAIRDRGARLFYANRLEWPDASALDDVFVAALPGYDFSSNRLDYANHVLSWTTNNDWRAMRDHFVAITNQLLSSGQPLSVITVGVP
jgi:hypothetical protein